MALGNPLSLPAANHCRSFNLLGPPVAQTGPCTCLWVTGYHGRVTLPPSENKLPWMRKVSMIRLMSEDEIGEIRGCLKSLTHGRSGLA